MEELFLKILDQAIIKDSYGRPVNVASMPRYNCAGLNGLLACDSDQLSQALIKMHQKYYINITAEEVCNGKLMPIAIQVRQEGIDYFNQNRE